MPGVTVPLSKSRRCATPALASIIATALPIVSHPSNVTVLPRHEITRPLARQRVMVIDYPDGRVALLHQGVDLPYRTFDRLQKVNQAAIVENKRLSEVLAYVAERQRERTETRSAKAPRRRGEAERHMFKLN
jgi:hypothetical protein